MDKLLQKIFDDSEKAEFLEAINEFLPNCQRAIVVFETQTDFQYFQLGFNRTYEVIGFLNWIENMVREAEKE